jgi:rod shape-determining protein MreC
MEDLLHTRHASNLSFVFLLSLTIFLLSAHLTGYVHLFKNFVYYIFSPSPITASKVVLSSKNIGGNIREIVQSHQENIALRKTLQDYEKLDSEYHSALDENARLRSLVNFPAPPGTRPVVARVSGREPESWFQSIIIDRGAGAGITVDAPVLAWKGTKPVVLGRVGDVHKDSSEIVLLTNPLFSSPAQIRSSAEDGLMEGQNSPYLKMSYLLLEGKAAIGDEVVTSPLSSVFPQGLAIGTIRDILPSANEPFKTAIIEPAVNVNSLREVVVLIEKNK